MHNFPNQVDNEYNDYKEKKLLSKNTRKKAIILWGNEKRHVNKALRSASIKPSNIKNRTNQIRELKKKSFAS